MPRPVRPMGQKPRLSEETPCSGELLMRSAVERNSLGRAPNADEVLSRLQSICV
jgi:hypothetical protein